MEKFYLLHQGTNEKIDIQTWYSRCIEDNAYTKQHFEVVYPKIEEKQINLNNFYSPGKKEECGKVF
jgi:hypothetical protein